MKPNTKEQIILRQYLLGDLSEESQRQVEERLLTDTDSLEELEIIEEELIDQYLSGTLTSSEQEVFETRFLSTPDRRRKLSFARAFKKYVAAPTDTEVSDTLVSDAEVADTKASDVLVSANKESKLAGSSSELAGRSGFLPAFMRTGSPLARYSLAAVLILIVGLGSWLAIKNRLLRNPSDNHIVTALLTPGAVRGAGEMKRITIPPETDTVYLQLELAQDDSLNYRAVLLTDDGREMLTQSGLKAQTVNNSRSINFIVPAKDLPRGDYKVKLSTQTGTGEFEDIASYTFRILQ